MMVFRGYKAKSLRKTPKNYEFSSKNFLPKKCSKCVFLTVIRLEPCEKHKKMMFFHQKIFPRKMFKMLGFRGYMAKTIRKTPKNDVFSSKKFLPKKC